jgi:hypothetical protein
MERGIGKEGVVSCITVSRDVRRNVLRKFGCLVLTFT